MKKFFIVAGDPSGDIHASRLMQAIYSLSPETEFIGIGGKEMSKAGLKSIAPIEEMSIVGFWEVAKKYGYFKKIFNKCSNLMKSTNFDAFIPVDYPGFNIRLSRIAKENKIPVIYYIAPQLWAWGKNRAEKIAKNTDLLLTVFPFEVEFFTKYGIKTVFTGHPLFDYSEFDTISPGFSERENLLALLPGSRTQELKKNLPIMKKIAEKFLEKNKDFNIGIAGSVNINKSIYSELLQSHPDWQIYDSSIELMMKSKAGLVKTGTSNLEAALCGMPFIMLYKTSSVTYFFGKKLVDLEYISLVNILAGKNIVKEYIQNDIDVHKITGELQEMTSNMNKFNMYREEFLNIKKMLGEKGSSENAAKTIINFLEDK